MDGVGRPTRLTVSSTSLPSNPGSRGVGGALCTAPCCGLSGSRYFPVLSHRLRHRTAGREPWLSPQRSELLNLGITDGDPPSRWVHRTAPLTAIRRPPLATAEADRLKAEDRGYSRGVAGTGTEESGAAPYPFPALPPRLMTPPRVTSVGCCRELPPVRGGTALTRRHARRYSSTMRCQRSQNRHTSDGATCSPGTRRRLHRW